MDLSGAPVPTTVPIPAHGSVTIVCSADVTCPGLGINVSVTGTAVASESIPCVYNVQHEVITTAASTCNASVNCVVPVTCRVTGGGDLYDGDVDHSCIDDDANLSPRLDRICLAHALEARGEVFQILETLDVALE